MISEIMQFMLLQKHMKIYSKSGAVKDSAFKTIFIYQTNQNVFLFVQEIKQEHLF